MKDVFVPTENFQRLQSICDDCMDSSHGLEMAAVLGRAGRGKTTAAHRIATMNLNSVFVRFEEWMSPIGLIREITFNVAGTRPRAMQTCRGLLQDELSRQRRIVLVDEADRMSLRHLNALRDLHDIFRAPVVMIGEESLRGKLGQERRLVSRVRETVNFQPVGQNDIVVFYRKALDLALKPDHAGKFAKHSQGDFRLVVKDALAVERIMRASGLKEITEKLVGEVCR